MKKYFLLLAAGMMMTACSQDPIIEEDPTINKTDAPMVFGTSMRNVVKASENNGTANKQCDLEQLHNTFYVWGYKKVEGNFDAVFTGNATGTGAVGAANSIVTYNASSAAEYTFNWEYTPLRYWDKGAKYYNFFAVAPAAPTNSAWTSEETATGEKMVTFAIADYTLSGKSLKQSAEITNNEDALFGTSTTDNEDLMVADDILKNNETHANNKVNFEFNHILSRLNIALRKDASISNAVVKITELKVVNMKNKGSYQEGAAAQAAAAAGIADFDLAKGSAANWTPAALTALAEVGFKFNNASTAAAPTTTVDELSTKNYYIEANNTTTAATNILTTSYNWMYQGLVIPQTIAYKACELDGTNLNKDATDVPYLKMVYTIDGETFTSYYNLAGCFYKLTDDYADDYNVKYVKVEENLAKGAGLGEYLYLNATNSKVYTSYDDAKAQATPTDASQYCTLDELVYKVIENATEKYYDKDGNELFRQGNDFFSDDAFTTPVNGKTVVVTGKAKKTTGYEVACLTRGDAMTTTIGGATAPLDVNACDLTFNEGWMNNLKITIKPTAIVFDADVFEWQSKENAETVVE